MEEKKEITIELKSEPMNEMLSHPPSWIVRSGNSLFFILLIIAGFLSWIIEYPDEIEGEVMVSTTEPPIELSNQLYVQLKNVTVGDQEIVKEGQLLAEFDNRAKSEDIRKAQAELKQLSEIELLNGSLLPTLSAQLILGAYQNQWLALELKIEEWNSMQTDDLLTMRVRSMEQEITFRQRLQTISSRKIKLSEKDYALIQEELESSERLAKEEAISKQSLNQDRKSETQAMQSVQNQKEQYVQNMIQLNSLKKEINLLKHEIKVQEEKAKSELELAIVTLKNSLLDWEKSAIWLAPCNGKVIFNKQLQVNKYYGANQASIVIVPEGNGYSAIAVIPSDGAGKVKKGQKANIELLDFPKTEYGTIEGIVEHITLVDKEGKYEVRIKLPKTLKTSFKKSIPLKAQLKGKVKIITKKKRLIERFFEKLIDLVK
jgi:multidrug resistance efflux pump